MCLDLALSKHASFVLICLIYLQYCAVGHLAAAGFELSTLKSLVLKRLCMCEIFVWALDICLRMNADLQVCACIESGAYVCLCIWAVFVVCFQNPASPPGFCRQHKSSPSTSPPHQRESPCELMSGALPTACLKWKGIIQHILLYLCKHIWTTFY